MTKRSPLLLLLLAAGGKQVPVCGSHEALLIINSVSYLCGFFSPPLAPAHFCKSKSVVSSANKGFPLCTHRFGKTPLL